MLADGPSRERGKLTNLKRQANEDSWNYVLILQQKYVTMDPKPSCHVRDITLYSSQNTTSSAYISHETLGQIGAIQKTTNHHVHPPASLCTRKRLVANNLESRSVRLSIGFHP